MDALFDSICSPGGACDVLGVWLAALLTILVLTYLIHDSFLFRLASSLLVGTAIGFASAVVVHRVLWDLVVAPLWADLPNWFSNTWALLIFLVFFCFPLWLRLAPNSRATTWSNLGLAYLFGIGAALAIGGALSGILAPQLVATMSVSVSPQANGWDWLNGILIVVGTLGAFLTFRFIQPGNRPWQRVYDVITRTWGTVGRGFIMVAFGALLAGLIFARVSALVGQLYFLIHDLPATLFK
ncbi:MAG: hypothetical protein HY741_06765 [Chloroflexi bacterium]|nr:hypothetical protein [Chloroflexota bacterium]